MAGGDQGEQADGAGAEDGDGPSGEVRAGEPDRVHGRGQRFDEHGEGIAELRRDGHDAVGRDDEEVGEATGGRGAAEEDHGGAEVVAAVETVLAAAAGEDRLDHHAPADRQVHTGAGGLDGADDLVTGVVGQRHEGMPAVCGVDVGPADADGAHADQHLARAGCGRAVRSISTTPGAVTTTRRMVCSSTSGSRLRAKSWARI